MKNKKSMQRFLNRNLLLMVVFAFCLVIVPVILILGMSSVQENRTGRAWKSAKELLQPDYHTICTDELQSVNGLAVVVTGDYQVICLTGQSPFAKKQISKEEWTTFLTELGIPSEIRYDVAYCEEADYWLVIGEPEDLAVQFMVVSGSEADNTNTALLILLVVIGIYVLLLCVGGAIYSYALSRKVTEPVKELALQAKELEHGHYIEQNSSGTIVELQWLQEGLNTLSRQLARHEKDRDEMEKSQKRLIMEVSHDLKTPLASVQGYSERALQRLKTFEGTASELMQIEKDLEIVHKQGMRANELLHSLLYYSRLESHTYELCMQKLDLCEVVRRIVAESIGILEENGFVYEAVIPEIPCYVEMDESLVRRAIENLLYNSIKYNKAGTTVIIMVAQQKETTTVTVKDNGKGIDSKEAITIFEPFARGGDKARTSKDGGNGLGLAIVKKVMELHNGEVTLQTALGDGCEFQLQFHRYS